MFYFSEFASCETRDMKKSMDYGDKSCRQENPEKNGSESSREITSTEMIPGLHPPAFFGYTAFSSDTSSLHSPLGAAMPSPSAPTSQPIAESESVPMNGQWQKGKYIGSGAFGCVYEATNRYA